MRSLALIGLLLPQVAFATTYRVGSIGTFTPGATSRASISAAVSSAVAGDVIEIGAGTYNEQVTVGVSVTLRGVAVGSRPLLQNGLNTNAALTVTGGAQVRVERLSFTSVNDRRCARVINGADLELDDTAFTDCTHTSSGAALFVQAGASATVQRSEFANTPGHEPFTSTDGLGGFLHVAGDLVIEGSSFEGGLAAQGGAIFVDGGTLIVRPYNDPGAQLTTLFLDNRAVVDGALPARGGALHIDGGVVQIEAASFIGNVGDEGAHLSLVGGVLSDVDTVWTDGVSARGALFFSDAASATLLRPRIRDNTATDAGGGLYATDAGSLVLDAAVLSDNTAATTGGGYQLVSTNGTGTYALFGASVQSCSAPAGGAGYVSRVDEFSDTGGLYQLNRATSTHGGALYLDQVGLVELASSTFDQNTAVGSGGGAYLTPGSGGVQLTETEWSSNAATSGGALYGTGAGSVLLQDSVVRANLAADGAGVRLVTTAYSSLRNVYCLNAATGNGGAVRLNNSQSSFSNDLFDENRAATGSAIQDTSGVATLSHLTVLGSTNTGSVSLGAVLGSLNTTHLRDSLIGWTTGGAGVRLTAPATSTAARLAFWNNPGGDLIGLSPPDSLTTNPLLVSWAYDGVCNAGAAWPAWDSPLRDRHPTELDPDGTAADLGAYGGPLAAGLAPWLTDNDTDGDVTLTDCDDTNPARRTTATELPNDGVDTNCDRTELCPTDTDGDGFGSAVATTRSTSFTCTATGVVPNTTDCDDNDASERPGVQWYRDGDGDTWGNTPTSVCARTQASDVGRAGDCNDNAAAVRPGATELPADGVDQDCNGAELCYVDADLDGFGGATTAPSTVLSCNAPPLTAASDDCDDNDPAEHPGVVWRPDADRDGYGSSTQVSQLCSRANPTDLTDAQDCDDTRVGVHPGATELAGDGLDSNCDGQERCFRDLDGDGFGRTTTWLSANLSCVGPGISPNDDDCDDDASNDTASDLAALKFPGAIHFRDRDGDGRGTPTQTIIECTISPGYSLFGDDCDDDPTDDRTGVVASRIFPGATYFADADGDGHGRAGASLSPTDGCLPAGYSVLQDDCDDVTSPIADAARIYPGAPYYTDADGDGFGGLTPAVQNPAICVPPPGLILTTGDCDDTSADDTLIRQAALVYPGATYFRDVDADGYGGPVTRTDPAVCEPPAGHVVLGGDCNDTTGLGASIFPGATYYRDLDGDGFGRANQPTTPATCGLPVGYSVRSTDCDDDASNDRFPGEAAAIFPGAAYYRDADADTWGRAGQTTTTACAVPTGYVPRAGDCDDDPTNDTVRDQAALIFPGATYYLDLDGDGFGLSNQPLSVPGLCALPPSHSVRSGDCDEITADDQPFESAPLIFPGATYYLDLDGDHFGVSAQSTTPATCGVPAGYTVYGADCDDDPFDDQPYAEAARVYPGATYYADTDGDGWGAGPGLNHPGCTLSPGWSTSAEDCDDEASDDTPARTAALIYPGATYYADLDGDGFSSGGLTRSEPALCEPPPGFGLRLGDCDDDPTDDLAPGRLAALIFPGATYYADRDGDGYGDALTPLSSACALPPSASVLSTDCDDTPADDRPPAVQAARTFPGATYYADADADGYGRSTAPYLAADCTLPAGMSTVEGDCDDDASNDALPRQSAALQYPGATFYPDRDSDGYGVTALAYAPGDCAVPSGASVTGGDCNDDPTDVVAAATYPGASYYRDADADGYGRSSASTSTPGVCAPPAGYAARSGDCDDEPADDTIASVAALIFPGGVYFPDLDGDGWGAGFRLSGTSCALPAGASVRFGDCDDNSADDTFSNRAALIFPGAIYFPDNDGDGYGRTAGALPPAQQCTLPPAHSVIGGDCDDDPSDDTVARVAAALFPGATYYADLDGDGYGASSAPYLAADCVLPAEHSVRDDDCDDDPSDDTQRDRAAFVFPGATYFLDLDGDGFGDPSTGAPFPTCALPADRSVDRTDCEDDQPTAYPGSTEVLGNSSDEDCDGELRCYIDLDGDSFGRFVGSIGDDGSGDCTSNGEATRGGDCDDDPTDDDTRRLAALIYPGADEACGDGIDSNCSCRYPQDATAPTPTPDFPGTVGCGDERGDEDGDGLTWLQEAGDFRIGEPGLGSSDCSTDSDLDTLGDDLEFLLGTNPASSDSDGDGLTDQLEIGDPQSPNNTDCPLVPLSHVQCDALIDALDDDDDGDGIPTAYEGQGDVDCADPAAGDYSRAPDGVPNHLDFDSDGDGIPDATEGTADLDNDRLPDWIDCELGDRNGDPDCDNLTNAYEDELPEGPLSALNPDSDGDGVPDATEIGDDAANPRDSDGDGLIDALDDDDDDDGVPTSDELGLRCANGELPRPLILPDPCNPATQWDAWGRLYICPDRSTPTPRNTDALVPGAAYPVLPDRTPDWLDDDDDGDGVSTLVEASTDPSTGAAWNRDGDPLPDWLDPNDGDGPLADLDGDGLNRTEEDLLSSDPFDPDSDHDGVPDRIEAGLNSDGDDLPDLIDPDDDNDLIPTLVEGRADLDDDGLPNHLDDDSDGDGLLDLDEGDQDDQDCDGLVAFLDPYDADGPCGGNVDSGYEQPFDATVDIACGGCDARGGAGTGWMLLTLLVWRRRARR